jgi:hypothetical protein
VTAVPRPAMVIPAWRILSGQVLFVAGISGGVLTILASWSNIAATMSWMHGVEDGFVRIINGLFLEAASLFSLGLTQEGAISLLFTLSYLAFIAGSFMIEMHTPVMISRLKRFVQVFIVSYLIWPFIFFLSYELHLWTGSDKYSVIFVFLATIALSSSLLNNIVPLDLETIGLLILFFICNVVSLAHVAEAIFGRQLNAASSFWRTAAEVLLPLLMIMVLFFPVVLTPRKIFKSGLIIMMIGAAIAFAVNALIALDISHLELPRLRHCCVLRLPPPADSQNNYDDSRP